MVSTGSLRRHLGRLKLHSVQRWKALKGFLHRDSNVLSTEITKLAASGAQRHTSLLMLPPELIREIFFYLGSRPGVAFKTIKSCSLVCSTLRPFAQELLFAGVTFYPATVLDSSSRHLAHTMFKLAYRAPHVLSYVRRVYIGMDMPFEIVSGFQESQKWVERIRRVVGILSTRALYLQEVELAGDFREIEVGRSQIREIWESLVPLFHNCKRLCARMYRPCTRCDFYRLLNLFPDIEWLSVASSFQSSHPQVHVDSSQSIIPSPVLRLHELQYRGNTELVDTWVTPLINPTYLHTIYWSIQFDGGTFGDLPRIVHWQSSGPGIRYATLCMQSDMLQAAMDHIFPYMPSLVTLSLSVNKLAPVGLELSTFSSLFRSLGHSPRLRMLYIRIHGSSFRIALPEALLDLAHTLLAHTASCPLAFRILPYGSIIEVPDMPHAAVKRRRHLVSNHDNIYEERTLDVTDCFDAGELALKRIARVELKINIVPKYTHFIECVGVDLA